MISQRHELLACDFFTVESLLVRRYYVLRSSPSDLKARSIRRAR